MTVEELIRKLEAFPADMPVKVTTINVVGVTQDGEDYVKLILE